MSGKRQHFIPQFLQKGFIDRSNGDKVWVYRKDAKSFSTNVINAGVESRFYSQENDNQLDIDITYIEGKFVTLMNVLRNKSEESTIDSLALAEMIAHFEIRTRHIRESVSSTLEYGLGEMLKILEDRDAFEAFLKRRMPSFMREKVRQEFKQQRMPKKMQELLLIASKPLIEQKISTFLSELPLMTISDRIRAEIPNMLKDTMKSGHIDGLKSTIIPQVKVDIYRNMQFSVKTTAELLPLGDSITVFQLSGERPFKPICEKDDPIEAVYLPLSQNQVLVGQFTDRAIDLPRLPMAIAQCSLEFFISSSNSNINEDLQSHIGEYAYFLSQQQISNILIELINETSGSII